MIAMRWSTTPEPGVRAAAAVRARDDDAGRIAEILATTFSADNHDTLDAEITRLMLSLSAEEIDGVSLRARSEGPRKVLRAMLWTLRGRVGI